MDRSRAGVFATVADPYEQARPSWPPPALDTAFERWGLDPRSGLVVDVAAGTGRLTTLLAQRCRDVLAVEPLVEMRAHIRDAPAVKGTAERIPLRDATASAIFVAEAFHWFDPAAALAEFARVLVPGGGLALMWNTHAPTEPQPWQEAVGRQLQALPPEARQAGTAEYRDPAISEWRSGPEWERFAPVEHQAFVHTQRLDRAGIVALVSSWSFIAALADDTRAELLAGIDRELATGGIERAELTWRCDLYLTTRA